MDPLTIGGILKAGEKVLDILDPTERKRAWQEHERAMEQMASDDRRAQMAVNQEEAKHDSLFVAGGRPSLIWVCSAGLAIAWPVSMSIQLGIYCYLIVWEKQLDTPPPRFNIAELMTFISGMMGLSYIRSDEKKKGVARESLQLKPKEKRRGPFSKFRTGRR